MALSAGRLRHQISIEGPDLVPNGRGGRIPRPDTNGWKVIDDQIWAEVLPRAGDEALRLGVERQTQLWRITIRYRADVTPGHRILFRSTVIDIKSAAPNEEGDGLIMLGESGVKG